MKIPAIRFNGFSNEWKEAQLDEVVDFFSGLTYSPKDVVSGDGTFVLRSSNVKNGEIVNADDVFVSSEVVNCENVKEGDIAVVVRNGSRSLIGKHAQIKREMKNTVIGAFMTGIRSGQPNFTNALLDSEQFNKEIEKNLGATINQITTGAFKRMSFCFPNTDEQTQIGSYFQDLDKLISLHQAKVNKLTNLKKAMLEKMFPKNGSNVPEIRFEGFEGAWKEKVLWQVFDDFKGTGLSKEKIGRHGKNKCILYGHLFTKFSEVIAKIDSRTDFDEGVLSKENDILMPSSTTTTGIDLAKASSLKESGVLLGGDIIILRMKEPGSSDFFAYYLTHGVNKEIAEVTQGTTIIHLYFSGLKDLILKIPTQAEQIKIAAYFQNLDSLINLHESELEKLNNLKKSCLEKMFV